MTTYPLSPLQHGMLFHYVQRGRASGVDIEQLEAVLPEQLDVAAFTAAWGAVAAEHEVLRTRFRWKDVPAPEQEVAAPGTEAPIVVRDLAQLPSADQTAHLIAFLEDDRREGFDLAAAPLWRVTVFRLADANYRMVWTYSHAILNSCYSEILREVFEAYDAIRKGIAPVFVERKSYREHIIWLQHHLTDNRDAAQAFWRERLAGVTAPTSLDAVMRPVEQRDAAAGHDTLRFRINQGASDAIRAQCAASKFRVSTFVEAAWALVLAAFSGQQEVVFGTTRACRRSSIPGADRIIGLFINTVPVRAVMPAALPLASFLSHLRAGQIAVRLFEHTPLVDVIASADVPNGSALFDTIIVFNDQDDDTRLRAFGDDFISRRFTLHDQTNFAIAVMAYDEPEIAFKLSFDRGRLDRVVLERMADLMTRLLEAMAMRPGATIGDLPRLSRQDELRLAAFNDTALPI